MLVHHLRGGQVESLAFGPDGRMLVVPRRDRGVLVWDDVTVGTPPRALPDTAGQHQFSNPHGRVRVSADGRRVGCHDWFRSCIYDTTGGAPLAVEPEIADAEHHAALTPDGEAIVLSQSRPRADDVVGRFEARLSLRPLADPHPAADRWAIDIERWVWDEAAFLPGGEFVSPEVTYPVHRPRLDHRWVVRDLATGRELRSSPDLGRAAAQATASPDGRWVGGVHGKHLVAWRPDDPGAPVVARKNDGPSRFTGVAFHPSGDLLATSTDAVVRVYDTAAWAVVRTYAWDVGKLRCVAFSPDGLLAAAGSDSGKIVVWDVDL